MARETTGRAAQETRQIEPLLTIRDVVGLSRLGERTIHMLVKERRMPAPTRFGKALRWNPAAIRQWLLDGSPKPRRTSADTSCKRPVGRPRLPA